jgi:hypothetical protein
MKSRWYELKPAALLLRKKGQSLRFIEANLGIPRSTLSGWFKDIRLSESQELALAERRFAALSKARDAAAAHHRSMKLARMKEASQAAEKTLLSVQLTADILDLALAMLYWGEGKKSQTTALGAADPLMLQFFLAVLKHNYNIQPDDITCELHLRHDQTKQEEVVFWSQKLGIPPAQFKRAYFDRRARGITRDNYHGVCLIYCSNIAIQRKLVYLYKSFCEKVSEMGD